MALLLVLQRAVTHTVRALGGAEDILLCLVVCKSLSCLKRPSDVNPSYVHGICLRRKVKVLQKADWWPPRCPRPNPLNPGCYGTGQDGVKVAGGIQVALQLTPTQEDCPASPGWALYNHRVLKGGRGRNQSDVTWEGPHRSLRAWRTEEEPMRPRLGSPCVLPWDLQKGAQPGQHLDLRLVRPALDVNPQNREIRDLMGMPLSWW